MENLQSLRLNEWQKIELHFECYWPLMVSNDKTNLSKVKNLLNGFVSYYLILFHRHDPSSIKSNSVSKHPRPENSVFVLISRNGNFRFLAKNWTKIEEFNAYYMLEIQWYNAFGTYTMAQKVALAVSNIEFWVWNWWFFILKLFS